MYTSWSEAKIEPTGQKYNSSICTVAQKPGNIFSYLFLMTQASGYIGSMPILGPVIQPKDHSHVNRPPCHIRRKWSRSHSGRAGVSHLCAPNSSFLLSQWWLWACSIYNSAADMLMESQARILQMESCFRFIMCSFLIASLMCNGLKLHSIKYMIL